MAILTSEDYGSVNLLFPTSSSRLVPQNHVLDRAPTKYQLKVKLRTSHSLGKAQFKQAGDMQ